MLTGKVPLLLALFTLTTCSKQQPEIIAPVIIVETEKEIIIATDDGKALRDDFERNVGNKVYFAFDKATLSKEAKDTLRKQAEWLNSYPNVIATIEGHCDEIGSKNYNLALGLRRAEVVEKFLVAQGVNKNRLATVTYGKGMPEVAGDNAWKQNRRVVSVVINKVQ